jgi:hypothetical protein
MPTEIFRTRDCVVFRKGDAYTVNVSDTMRTSGWRGGQGVRWVDSPKDEFLVGYSDGLYGGFLLWGSDESSDKFTAITMQQPEYGYAVFCAGGWLISTTTFEKYTYLSRIGGGPLVPIVYTPGVRLRFSLRGLWTTEDEWTLALDPRAPNNFYVGTIVENPSALTNLYLTLQTSI